MPYALKATLIVLSWFVVPAVLYWLLLWRQGVFEVVVVFGGLAAVFWAGVWYGRNSPRR